MSEESSSRTLTELLSAVSSGSVAAREQLWGHAYPELKRIAHRELGRRQSGQTLQTTSLVNEAYCRLAGSTTIEPKDRVHFFALAATAMRHILIDYARSKQRQKRGSGQRALTLDEEDLSATAINSVSALSEDIIDLDEALNRLSEFDARAARVVECRYFGGLGVDETAAVLEISPRTVKRDWAVAKAWLLRELRN